jgi:P2 family phage major capsid protein
MQPYTRARWKAFCSKLATTYGVDASIIGTVGAEHFSMAGAHSMNFAAGATPTPEQRLVTRMQDTTEFLRLINVIGVIKETGQTVGLLAGTPVASRANTAGTGIASPQRRVPIDPTGLDNFPYACVPTEFNPLFPYQKLDQWAQFPDFETRMRDIIIKRMALDRIQIGWNGNSVALSAGMTIGDPTLASMNEGWIWWMLNNNAERVLKSGATTNEIQVGTGSADNYATIDALVLDARMTLLPPWAREDVENLIAFCGADVLHDKYFPIANRQEGSLDLLAQQSLNAQYMHPMLGGIRAMRVPFMPAGTVLITRPDNISLYYQLGSMRRMLRDEPQWNRVVDYQSSNEAYVIEDPNYAVLIQNITMLGSVTTPAGTQETTDNTDAPE